MHDYVIFQSLRAEVARAGQRLRLRPHQFDVPTQTIPQRYEDIITLLWSIWAMILDKLDQLSNVFHHRNGSGWPGQGCIDGHRSLTGRLPSLPKPQAYGTFRDRFPKFSKAIRSTDSAPSMGVVPTSSSNCTGNGATLYTLLIQGANIARLMGLRAKIGL